MSENDRLHKLEATRLQKLEAFFREVADLTANHRVDEEHDRAWVAPSDLGAALEKVDPDWSTRPSSSVGRAPDS